MLKLGGSPASCETPLLASDKEIESSGTTRCSLQPIKVTKVNLWLVVWNIHFCDFPYIGNNNFNWLSYFFRGVETNRSYGTPLMWVTSEFHLKFDETSWGDIATSRLFRWWGEEDLGGLRSGDFKSTQGSSLMIQNGLYHWKLDEIGIMFKHPNKLRLYFLKIFWIYIYIYIYT